MSSGFGAPVSAEDRVDALHELLSRYVFSELRGGELTLYRGRGNGLDDILLVAPVGQYPSRDSLKRLDHEYALRDALDPDWAARPVALVPRDGRVTLVLEDPGGEPLDGLLGRPLEVTQFLRIAIGLAATLRRVHERGLIHKDIKPANVLVESLSGRAWLTGFGIASRLARERPPAAPADVIAGTLAYMAPEQTGRMNRSVDSRSDLYSLGVTLYEMLTGALPFSASDALGWIHCHIAQQAVAPSERTIGVPPQLSAIVMKLLAKTADDRYQTAAGAEVDLRRCLAAWDSFGCIPPFQPGAHDVSDRLLIPERLYGREREIDVLRASFDRAVATGGPELVFLSGYSGIGKSSVVNELRKVLVPSHALFASGKVDESRRDVPYAILGEAFQSLVSSVLRGSEAELGQWRDDLREALGTHGQLVVDLIPDLELVLGPQPPVTELTPQDATSRSQMLFQRMVAVFARPEHPLVLFLDDVQWLDAATLGLLEHLITHSDVRHLLLIGAYRDNEVSAGHPLMRTLEAIRTAGEQMHEIALAPLGLDDVDRLVAATLHCEPERALPLAELVHEKTGGNPFFAIQFLTALADERLLAFDPVARAWQWDIDRIRAKSYTDNVVELMAGKLKRLTAPTQEALKQLACLGNVADFATLSLASGATTEAMHAELWEAVQAGLVFRLESAYTFLHDRIQQAAYSLIPEEHRAGAHLRIGRVLLGSMTIDAPADDLFEVATQLNRGAAVLVDRDEKAQVARIDLRAGRTAKACAAYASACVHLAAGMVLLDEGEWDSQYELMFSLWLERADCEFLTGNLETAEQLIGELLKRGSTNVDRAAVHHLKVQVHVAKSENPQAVASALECLSLFGIDIPAHPTWDQVQAEYESIWRTLDGRPLEGLIDLPLLTDPEQQAAMRLLSVLTSPAYFTDLNLCCLHLCRMVNISMRHGTSGPSAHAFGFFGVLLGPVFHRYHEGYRFAKLACDLVEQRGFLAYRAKVHDALGTLAFWTQPFDIAMDSYRSALRTGTATGDVSYACYSIYRLVAGGLLRNDPLDAVWRESEKCLHFVRNAGFRDVADFTVSQQRFIAAMQGRTATISTFSDGQFDEAEFEAQLTGRMPTVICMYLIAKLKSRFLAGDYVSALAAAQQAEPLLWALVGQIEWFNYYYFAALTVAAQYENAPADEQTGWRQVLTTHLEQLREWSDNYPPTFGDKHALVAAEIARLEGRDFDAMRLYEQAIHSAREHGFVQNEGTIHEVAARFYEARGFETIAYTYLRNARQCYRRWGAEGKVRQLDELYPHLQEERAPMALTATIATPLEQLDVETVVRASQALSSEIVLPTLIETIMRLVVEQAGAERGLLILLRDDNPQIEAEATSAHGRVNVTVRQTAVGSNDLPRSALHYVMRTRKLVALDDAAAMNAFSEDDYVREKRPRSLLCLPIITQTKLVGALYLENNLTPSAFATDRVAVLELLASQAAISLENARLYSDLQRSEAFLADGQSIGQTGSFGWSVPIGELHWSDETYRIFEYDRAVKPTVELILQRVHPDDRTVVQETINRASNDGREFDLEHRLLMPDGRVKYVHVLAHALQDASRKHEFVGAVVDTTKTKQAALAERTRIAQELHDTLLQGFTGITLQLWAIERGLAQRPHEGAEALKSVLDSADAALREARRMIWDMRAVELEGQDLASALEATIRAAATNASIALVFFVHGDRRRLPVAVETTVLRIGREAVVNAVKHAAPRTVEVYLEYEARSLRLRVVDNGTGIPPSAMEAAAKEGHLGIVGMRERALRTGGTFEISSPGQGTIVSVSLPIRERPASSSDLTG
jgi:predicted ATPase/signal transduction histidine kinase